MYKLVWLPQKFKYFTCNYWIPWLCLFIVRQQAEHHCCISRCLKSIRQSNHNILMSKPLHNGVRGVMQHWAESYLSNRKQHLLMTNQKVQFLYVKNYIGWAQYSFFCISMTCIDPQIRCVLFILLMIQQFLHLAVTLTMSMPLWIGSW